MHIDSKAAEAALVVNGRTFTVGQNVVFGPERFSPDLSTGKRLLAHEYTHMVQQDNGRFSSIVWRWKLKSNEKCRVVGVDRA